MLQGSLLKKNKKTKKKTEIKIQTLKLQVPYRFSEIFVDGIPRLSGCSQFGAIKDVIFLFCSSIKLIQESDI